MKISFSEFTTKKPQLTTFLLLLLWIAIGAALRLTNLTAKPPWTDEFATMVFSLGHSFQTVPLDQAIALDVLLEPLQTNLSTNIGDVIRNLLTEDHHPPLYFVLSHLWLNLFPPEGGLVSVFGARSLATLFGIIAIPAAYSLGKLAFRSAVVGHLSAAMMAVSPYAIYIAQEARHYTLVILFVMASLACLAVAGRCLREQKPLPLWTVFSWIVANSLALATHYFFSLTLVAESMVLAYLWWIHRPKSTTFQWGRILLVALGTAAGGLVWVLVWQHSYNSEMTQWIQSGDRNLLSLINPLAQALAGWIAMLVLLPVESEEIPIVIVSGLAMLIFLIWTIPILVRGIKFQLQQPENNIAAITLGGFVLAAISLFFGMAYILGIDITRGPRYNFVYFPAVIIVIGASLAACWQGFSQPGAISTPEQKSCDFQLGNFKLPITNQKAVGIILAVGILSSITVANNLGYRKYYRPDFLVPIIQQASHEPVLIATTHKTLVQTGEMMGVALEFKRTGATMNPLFLLAHQNREPQLSTDVLQKTLAQMPRPLDLWLVNFHAPKDVGDCVANPETFRQINGYDYQMYRCPRE